MKTRVDIKPPGVIIKSLGADSRGDVQRFHTNNVNRRIGKYMPHLTGMLETKSKHIASNTEIEVVAPYARYQYYGKAMVDASTGKGPAYIPGVGYRFRRGAQLVPTERDLQYTTTFNPQAGPYWDRRLVAAENSVMRRELQAYINRKGGRK